MTLAERLLASDTADDIAIALGQIGWKIVGPDGEKWMMVSRVVLTPPWAVSVAEQDRDARAGAAVVAEIERHQSRPKKHHALAAR